MSRHFMVLRDTLEELYPAVEHYVSGGHGAWDITHVFTLSAALDDDDEPGPVAEARVHVLPVVEYEMVESSGTALWWDADCISGDFAEAVGNLLTCDDEPIEAVSALTGKVLDYISYIERIEVAQRAQGKGIGRALLKYIIDSLHERSMDWVVTAEPFIAQPDKPEWAKGFPRHEGADAASASARLVKLYSELGFVPFVRQDQRIMVKTKGAWQRRIA